MKLYGSLTELSSLTIRLASGKTVEIQAAVQTASTNVITIPDIVDGADELVLKDTAVTMTNKTLTSPVVTNIDIQSAYRIKLPTAEPDVAEIGKLYYHSGRLKISNSASNATAHDKVVTEVSTDSFQNKTINATSNTITEMDPATSFRTVAVHGDKVVKYMADGVPEVGKIVNANVDAAAGIEGSKFADNSISVSKIVTAETTGTGSLVRASSPTITTPSIAQINTPAQSLAISGTGALRLPVGDNSANRPTGTAANLKGMIRYNDTEDAFEGYNELSGWSSLGGGGATERVNQVGLGILATNPIGTPLYVDAVGGWTKAKADAANTAEVAGILGRRISDDQVEVTLAGEVAGLTSALFENPASLPAKGEVVFLSPTTAGKLTVTEPSVVGQISKPVGIVHNVTVGTSVDVMFYNMRGTTVGAANARTTISVGNNQATNVVSVVDYNSLKLEGELNVTRSSGGNQRAYYTVEAAKNGAGVWQVSASYTGDDVLYTTLPSWDVASNNLQVTMPLVTNFSSASLTYALNAPAVGASLPLSIDSSALNILDSAPLSYRNRIINGDMRIDQRAAAISANNTYSVDRWKLVKSNDAVESVAQNSDAPVGFTASLRNTVTTADTSISAAQYSGLEQRIEGYTFSDFAFGTASAKSVTISFWVRSSVVGQYTGVLSNSDFSRNCPFEYTIGVANIWEFKTVTLAGCTDGTWNTTNGIGAIVQVSIALGSTYTTGNTAGTWTSNTNCRGSGSPVNGLSANGNIFALTGVQLEVGSKASAFERRPYGMELALCQRYYEKQSAKTYASYTPGSVDSVLYGSWSAEKRVSPNLSVSATTQINTVAVGAVATKSWIAGLSSGGAPGICAATITAEAEL
jgi:hypothetical protein